jgi:predicted ATP-dependent protease
VAGLAAAEGLRAFTAGAVGALVDYAARAADDSRRLSIRFSEIADVVREAHYWAGQAGADVVERQAVETALAARIRRLDLTQENIADAFLRDVVLLATDGTAVGQVNGVTVFSVGEVDFGVPVRITARVHQGAGEVVDIEREVELGGPLHSKGVLILGGYIAGRYVPDDALAMAATLTFEQSAAHIDGDSASAGELCALLSAIARVPLRQGIAVTGSVNQAGEIQAVGAVNQKVEGFFDICAARGLTGTQGVILPAANVQHLMLRADVVEAVREGRFHIYAVRTVDDSLEILTGLPAGERSALGDYPKDSVNRRIEERLRRLAAHRNSGGADPGE